MEASPSLLMAGLHFFIDIGKTIDNAGQNW